VARPGDEANAPLGKDILYLQRRWVQRAVCRLLALNVGSLAVIVSLSPSLLARNVSPKHPLFAGPGAAVCKPLQITHPSRHTSTTRPWICRPDGKPFGFTTGLGQRFALPTYPQPYYYKDFFLFYRNEKRRNPGRRFFRPPVPRQRGQEARQEGHGYIPIQNHLCASTSEFGAFST